VVCKETGSWSRLCFALCNSEVASRAPSGADFDPRDAAPKRRPHHSHKINESRCPCNATIRRVTGHRSALRFEFRSSLVSRLGARRRDRRRRSPRRDDPSSGVVSRRALSPRRGTRAPKPVESASLRHMASGVGVGDPPAPDADATRPDIASAERALELQRLLKRPDFEAPAQPPASLRPPRSGPQRRLTRTMSGRAAHVPRYRYRRSRELCLAQRRATSST